MGQQFSHVADRAQRADFQQTYDMALAFLVLNLVVVSLPTLGLFWVPFAGHWIQLGLAAVGLVFASILYQQSNKHLTASALNRSQWALAAMVFLAALIGAGFEATAVNRYFQCQADYNRITSEYYARSTLFYQKCYQPVPVAVDDSGLAATSSVSSYSSYNGCFFSEPYPQWTCWDLYDPTAIGFSGIAVPIFALVQMVLFSVQCSRLWNQVIAQSYEGGGAQVKPITIQFAPASVKSAALEATPLMEGLPMYRSDVEKAGRA